VKLTLALTVFNRYDLLLESFAKVIDDPRIDEMLIMDDCSAPEYWDKIKVLPDLNPKIKVVRQLTNQGMSMNKMNAVFNSKNEWVILGDSDNVFGKDYLDALEAEGELLSRFIYCPSFAKPQFDYRKFERKIFSISRDFPDSKGSLGVKPDLNDSMLNCLFNTCNYVVKRDEYLKVWKENKEMKASDTIYFNYLWLKAGNYFTVLPNMHYFHRVHKESAFLQDLDYNMGKAEEVKKLIMEL
jgi:glycosyltransferase involved in cell wall biosynthesis